MEFRTRVQVGSPDFLIEPMEEMLFVGSCFAENIGRRFVEEKFRATVNPFGVMYNPVSILHTVQRFEGTPRVVFLTLGTNHVYRLRETGEIVDNCQKRPASLFSEEQLSVDECADALRQTVTLLRSRRSDVHVVLTVSPIRYRKYGYHESQLSKATLLLAADKMAAQEALAYFPAYEIVMDELRDYRFYKEDMLHPSDQAVEYLWQQLEQHYLSPAARQFLEEWHPVKEALSHRPFHPDSEEYKAFMDKTMLRVAKLSEKYPTFAL